MTARDHVSADATTAGPTGMSEDAKKKREHEERREAGEREVPDVTDRRGDNAHISACLRAQNRRRILGQRHTIISIVTSAFPRSHGETGNICSFETLNPVFLIMCATTLNRVG